jgi:WD40 repeat protein
MCDNVISRFSEYHMLCSNKFFFIQYDTRHIRMITIFLDIAITCGTNKNMEIFDLGYNKRIASVNQVHFKPVQRIFLNEKTPYASHPMDSHNLFLTSSTDNCVKMWDLRTTRHNFQIIETKIIIGLAA